MTLSRFLITFSCLLLCLAAFSQVTIKGELRIGDSTQVHILNTKTGDRLVGRVTEYDEEKVIFLFKNSTKLEFPLADVLNIEVQSSPTTRRPGAPPEVPVSIYQVTEVDFLYLVNTKEGQSTSGRIVRCDNRTLRIDRKTGPDEYINWRDVDSLVLLSKTFNQARERPDQVHILKTSRGDRFAGQLQDYHNNTLRFSLLNGAILKFTPDQIQSIRLENVAITSEPVTEQGEALMGADRIFSTQSAFMLKRKETQYRNLMVLYNTIDHGISDHVTIGAGLFTVIFSNILSIRAKAGYDLGDYVHVAAGGQAFGAFILDEETSGALMGFGAITFGTPDKYLNISAGKGVATDNQNPFSGFNLGGSFRIHNKWRLFGEYTLLRDNTGDGGAFGIIGASWFTDKHRIDFGFSVFPVDEFDSIAFPVAGYAYRF